MLFRGGEAPDHLGQSVSRFPSRMDGVDDRTCGRQWIPRTVALRVSGGGFHGKGPSNRPHTVEQRRPRGGKKYLDPRSPLSISMPYEQRTCLCQGLLPVPAHFTLADSRPDIDAHRPSRERASWERGRLARIDRRRSCRPICGRDTSVSRARRSQDARARVRRRSRTSAAPIRADRVPPRTHSAA